MQYIGSLNTLFSEKRNILLSPCKKAVTWPCKIITIEHEWPYWIKIYHPSGQNLNQGRGLPSPWLNSDPEGEISLSYMNRFMMDCFFPTFEGFLAEHKN